MSLGKLVGNYQGTGQWYQDDRQTGHYDISQAILFDNDNILLRSKHSHADGNNYDMEFTLKPLAPHVYSLWAGDKNIGHGSLVNDVLRLQWNNKFFMPKLDSITEISYHPNAIGGLECYGSSSKNSAGNFITWFENLEGTS